MSTTPDNRFLVGTGVYDITGPAAELGMMGFSKPEQRTSGIHTRLYSRAFIVGDDSKRVVFVCADLLFMTPPVSLGVIEKLEDAFGSLSRSRKARTTRQMKHSWPLSRRATPGMYPRTCGGTLTAYTITNEWRLLATDCCVELLRSMTTPSPA